MERNELRQAREAADVTKPKMADVMGLSLRGYEELEAGRSQFRDNHRRALESALIHLAVEKADPNIMPADLQALIIKAANLIASKKA